MTAVLVGVAAVLAWAGLLASGFWRTSIRDTAATAVEPGRWPEVVAVVPARDEADVIARSLGSLAGQDYPGGFRIVLVDDDSRDGTAAIARSVARNVAAARIEVVSGASLPAGWTGKLWALEQGIARAGTPAYLWLTDADIAHAPDTLRTLVAIATAGDRHLVSLMAKLRCDSAAERALIPAFVYFFQLVYPFARINRAGPTAGAAGGCVLVRRETLAAAGGIAAIRGALIDDCALGTIIKSRGPIWLGLTDRSRSIRRYDRAEAVAAMIARSAYAQLGYRPWPLAGAVAGLALVYAAPPLLSLGASGVARIAGLVAWLLMAASFQPMLRFYRRSSWWGIALPGIATFYAGCTLLSAWQHRCGRGGAWKGRVQAMGGSR